VEEDEMARRGYPDEFRQRVVGLIEEGRKVSELAAELQHLRTGRSQTGPDRQAHHAGSASCHEESHPDVAEPVAHEATEVCVRTIALLVASVLLACNDGSRLEESSAADYFEDPRVVELAAAAARGDVEEVDQLIAGGVDVNAMGKEELTPLWWAFLARNLDGFSSLLDHGANPNVEDAKGRTVLCHAAAREDSRYLQRALAAGGDANRVSSVFSLEPAPLFCAVGNKNIQNIKLLHSAGANLNVQDYHLQTPMKYAADLNWWDIVYALLELGADPSIENNSGHTIVYNIESYRVDPQNELSAYRSRVVEVLRARGVTVTPRN
jgi:hypothetical protein